MAPQYRTPRQADLDQYLDRFVREYDYGDALLRLLRSDGAEVYRAERTRLNRWNLFVFLPENLQQLFDIELEVLCLATPYDHVEPRLANGIRDVVADNPRVDPNLAIVVSRDPGAEAMLSRRGDVAVLSLSAAALLSNEYGTSNLRTLLAQVLVAIDHFDVTTPVSSSGAFFGREQDISNVESLLSRQVHTGIFGLRKAGKTSLLNRIRHLRLQRSLPVARLDLNTVIDDPDLFRIRLVQALAQAHRDADRSVPKLRLLNPAGELRHDAPDVRRVWLDDLSRLLDPLTEDMVLILDEVDTALPAADVDESRNSGLIEPLTQLRGFIQTRVDELGRAITILSAGVDPAVYENVSVAGRPNPLYQFSTVQYLQPFTRDETAVMVRGLGKRSGLRFDSHVLVDRLFSEYGGHPLLTRQACSFVHTHRRNQSFPYHVIEDDLEEAFNARGPNSTYEHLLDVLRSFEEWFPYEAGLVRLRLSGDPEDHALAELALDEDPNAFDHAVGYGLLTSSLSPRMRGLSLAPG